MKSKLFYGVLVLLVIGSLAAVLMTKKPAPQPRLGTEQADHGREHVASKTYGGDEPPTSGPHAAPVPWGVYTKELADVNTVHNLEHGGIYVSYRPDLPKAEIQQLQELLFKPFSDSIFRPSKVIMAPRAANKSPIILSSWGRDLRLNRFNKDTVMNYYLSNIGKSPEPSAS